MMRKRCLNECDERQRKDVFGLFGIILVAMSVLDTSSWDKSILFFVNGKKIVVDDSKAVDQTLLSFLRSRGMGLTGTKLGCGEGGCGACSVMVSRYDPVSQKIDHRAVNACLALLPSLDGAHIVTIEGLGTIKSPHVVQRRIAEYHGSQCGFCTPGIVMALYAFLRNNPYATQADIEESFDGNLCRCTGYRPILDAAKTFGSDYEAKEGEGAEKKRKPGICPGTGLPCRCDRVEDVVDGGIKISFPDSPCDPIFPPFLKSYHARPLVLSYQPKSAAPAGELHSADGSVTPSPNTAAANACTWYRPTTVEELVKLKSQFPDARISVGTTEVTIEMNLKRTKYPYSHFISPMSIHALAFDFKIENDGIVVGAAVSLSVVTERCRSILKDLPEWKGRAIRAVVEQLRWFAGTQIRNVACLGGNIATASPISDINPVLLACGATLTIQSVTNEATGEIQERQITLDRNFFTGYRITALQKSDVIINVKIPFTREHEYILAFKQARRKDDDIAIASGAFRLNFAPESNVDLHHFRIESATLAYGGMAAFTKCASKEIEAYLVGKKISDIEGVFGMLESEFTLAPHAPGGMVNFRRSLVLSFFYKYMLYVQDQLCTEAHEFFAPELRSAFAPYHRPVSSGTQLWEGAHKLDIGPVGQSEVHVSALKQVTGEAQYVDDIPSDGALFAAYVFSEEAHAKILEIDASAALAHEGVVAYFDAKDVPGDNDCGAVVHDEEVFASKVVLCVGFPIGIVVAKTQKLAQQGAKLVKVTYEKLPSILTIAEAIEAQSFYPTRNELIGGNLDESTWAACDHIETGTFTMGGQEHFYLECQTTLAIPGEGDEMLIWSSTQNPTKTQYKVASVLGLPSNKVVTKLKRLGGGFGGKETRSVFVSCAAAVAAYKLRTPVRLSLDRDEDMASTGTRHPYYATYKVGFSKEGKLQALFVDMYSNAGCTQDLSINVGERSLLSLLSSYQCPNVHAKVNVCRTNWPSSTAFRGFGAPQSMILMEAIMDRVVSVVKRPANDVRELNFSKDGDLTYYGQKMPVVNATRVWSHLMDRVDYDARKKAVDEFNAQNRYVKRGIACMPTQFGLSFTFKPMNQAGALVHIYTDGTALVSTGGVEMGQGLNTKMIQVAAEALGLPVDKVHISETATDKVPNTMPSAASVSADLNGMAVLDACSTLKARLEPYLTKKVTSADGQTTTVARTFAEAAMVAHMDRVALSATGFYATPLEGFDWVQRKGTPFAYFTWGSACAEVEIDCLTGDHTVIRTDLVMDVGQSINPAIDIGQVEGGFAQGYGLTVLEELVTDDRHTRTPGRMFTRGPSTYKIPAFKDIPLQLNVHLLPNSLNPGTIHSSKGVGEPPLHLGAVVYFAIKRAITAARADSGVHDDFDFDSPATCERIRMACLDKFTSMITKDTLQANGNKADAQTNGKIVPNGVGH